MDEFEGEIVLRLARESGAWESKSLPSDWDENDIVFSRDQLVEFSRRLVNEFVKELAIKKILKK